jgi:hypothetical protein
MPAEQYHGSDSVRKPQFISRDRSTGAETSLRAGWLSSRGSIPD